MSMKGTSETALCACISEQPLKSTSTDVGKSLTLRGLIMALRNAGGSRLLEFGGVTASSWCNGGKGLPLLTNGVGGRRAALTAMKSDANGAK
jgi:hypothetical protein